MVDDDRLFADAIAEVLSVEGIDATGAPLTGSGALEAARAFRPDLVLIDLGLPDPSGIEVGRSILTEMPETKVLGLGASSNDRDVRAAMKAGFHGYMSKHASLLQFLASVRAVSEGQRVAPPQTGSNAPSMTEGDRNAALLARQLSPREKELLALLVDGASSMQIAEALSINPNTVRTHVQRILTKLQVHSRLEAATFAFKHGIVRVADGEPR